MGFKKMQNKVCIRLLPGLTSWAMSINPMKYKQKWNNLPRPVVEAAGK